LATKAAGFFVIAGLSTKDLWPARAVPVSAVAT
jgi:hypothetical protein